jgi:hypothetical protein
MQGRLLEAGFKLLAQGTREGTEIQIFRNEKSRLIVNLHDAVTVAENTAGGVGVSILDGKVYCLYSLPAPKQETCLTALAAALSDSSATGINRLLYHHRIGKESTARHEETHLACMHAQTPWGKAMFTYLLNDALQRLQQALESGKESSAEVAVTDWQNQMNLGREVSEDEFRAALLLSELRAHRHNLPTDQQRGLAALQVSGRIERALEVLASEQNASEGRKAPAMKSLTETLGAWQEFIAQYGYDVAGSEALQLALKMLLQHGSLRTQYDPPLFEGAEELMAKVTLE